MIARLTCKAEGLAYNMTSTAIVLGRKLPGEQDDVDFCHASDDITVAAEAMHIFCVVTDAPGVAKRFLCEVVSEAVCSVRGVSCAMGDRLPLNDGDIISLGRGTEIVFAVAPSGGGAWLDGPSGYSKAWLTSAQTVTRIQPIFSVRCAGTPPPRDSPGFLFFLILADFFDRSGSAPRPRCSLTRQQSGRRRTRPSCWPRRRSTRRSPRRTARSTTSGGAL